MAILLLAGLALVSVATPCDRSNAVVIFGCIAGSMLAALIGCHLRRRSRQPRTTACTPELVAVLETFDPAEAAHARHYLRQLGIEVEVAIEAQQAISSPPGSLRRVMVHVSIAEQAYGWLSEGGFNIAGAGWRRGNNLKRRRLRLIEGGGAGRPRSRRGRPSTQSPQ